MSVDTSNQNDNKPVHLFFSRLLNKDYLQDVKSPLIQLEHKIELCSSWDSLLDKFRLRPTTICVHYSELESCSALEIVNMVETLKKLVGLNYNITITIGITKQTSFQLVKDLQKSNIFGLIPAHSDFGFEENVKGLRAQWANIPYWPKHIIKQLPGFKNKKNETSSNVKLTPRQKQVYSMVSKRGATNKIIAKTLNISESTVKLHMGAILRKYGLRNRTQLAVFAKGLEV